MASKAKTPRVELTDADSGAVTIKDGVIVDLKLFDALRGIDNAAGRAARFEEIVRIGARAVQTDGYTALLAELERNLEGRLSEMRLLHSTRAEVMKSSRVGKRAERAFEDYLKDIAEELEFNDIIRATGDNSADGAIRTKGDRKIGDLEILVDGSAPKIVVESKYTGAGPPMGDLGAGRANAAFTIDGHARGQVRGAQANRGATWAMFVTKEGSAVHKTIKKPMLVDYTDMAVYVVADIETEDFDYLKIAYVVVRSLAQSASWPDIQQKHLRSVASLLTRALSKVSAHVKTLKQLQEAGEHVASLAEGLVSEFADERQAIDAAMNYLHAVVESGPDNDLDLRLRELELLTGEKVIRKSDD